MKTHWNLEPKKRSTTVVAELSKRDKQRLEFQRSFCSVNDVDRRRAENAAVRRSTKKNTGGRKSVPDRPHPDRDKVIVQQRLDAYEEMISVGDPRAVSVGEALLADADCLEGKKRCGHRSCSKCESARVQEDGERLKRSALEFDRMFIRATTILLKPIPIDSSTSVSAVADVLRQGARSLSTAVFDSGIRAGYWLLPDCRVVQASKIDADDHAADFIASHYPDWRQHETWMIPHFHGLLFLYEWHRRGDVEGLLRRLFPGTRAVEIKQLFRNQSVEEAASKWGRYCAEQEVRHGSGSRGKGKRLADLYSATQLCLIEEIHQLVRDESAFVQWADSDEFGPLREEPLEVDLQEVLRDIRCDEWAHESFTGEFEPDDYDPDWTVDDELNDQDFEGDLDEVLSSRVNDDSKRSSGIVSQTGNVSRGCGSSYRIKSSHYRLRQHWQIDWVRPQSRGPPRQEGWMASMS